MIRLGYGNGDGLVAAATVGQEGEAQTVFVQNYRALGAFRTVEGCTLEGL